MGHGGISIHSDLCLPAKTDETGLKFIQGLKMSDITSQLEYVRKRLVETGTRNRLIHVNRKTKRGNLINIINEKSDAIFKILKEDAKRMKIAGVGTEEDDILKDDIVLAEDIEFDEARYTDLIIETDLTPDALQKRLLKIATAARTAEEEQGLNILYLAMGFLRWYEDEKSEVLRESPLILLPVELVRNARTSALDLIYRDEDVVTNLPLQERLKNDFGIELPEIEDENEWRPGDYFNDVSDVIVGKPRWSIDTDGMQLGFFSFAKLLMLRDLDPENWISKDLTQNELIDRLLVNGFREEEPLIKSGEKIDAFLDVEKIFQVIDADSSQTKVIEEVNSGKNLVVQGPPGTGKSQTITNILAAAAHSGKKVLFVAEKMAALNVVHQRMVKVGLGDLCLELHSRTANKKLVLGELGLTLSKGSTIIEAQSVDDELKVYRDRLNEISNVIHSKIEGRDYSPFSVLSRISKLMGEDTKPPSIKLQHLEKLTFAEVEVIITKLSKYIDLKNKHGDYQAHPFNGVENLDIQPFDIQRLPAEINSFQSKVDEWHKLENELKSLLGVEGSESTDEIQLMAEVAEYLKSYPVSDTRLCNLLKHQVENKRLAGGIEATHTWQITEQSLLDQVTDLIWSVNLEEIRLHIAQGSQSWLKRTFGSYRKFSNTLQSYLKLPLPKSPIARLSFVDTLVRAAKEKKRYENEAAYLAQELDYTWQNEKTDISPIQKVLAWVSQFPGSIDLCSTELIAQIKGFDLSTLSSERVAELSKQLDFSTSTLTKKLDLSDRNIHDFEDKITLILENLESYPDWVQYHYARRELIGAGIEEYLIQNDEGLLADLEIPGSVQFAIFEEKWVKCQEVFPELSDISRTDRHQLVRTFSSLEEKKIETSRSQILKKHLENLPKGAVGEMGLIRGELAKKRRHKSIRYLMNHAGNMISRIKPIFLMSPISVAQFLPPEKMEFDLLVMDEASQVRPEDALGSIVRAKQIVVVGDQKQLPPTSFFDRLADNSETDDSNDEDASVVQATEMESILSLCEARGMHQAMLEWHYRSRDPSLITVSNLEFYDNRLILPPSPMENDDFFGLSLKQVPGAYSSASKGQGRPGTNRIEAGFVVDRLAELASTHPNFSVGIVTFSKSQADMITEILEFKRRSNPILDNCLRENKSENVFVKNIENVQGDERDIILISVGYGPFEPNQHLPTMNFGPINSDGGERRLNVLFSRSRVCCEVYTSFNPGDIDTSRTSKIGPKVLKTFLQFAENGFLPAINVSDSEPDSDFEIDVASVVRKLGYEADYQIGTAGFKIDIGVRKANSKNYILAIECDGATYHSALWARERDRLRQNILEGFGWKFHRIWSTDWFHRRESEMARLEAILNQCSELQIGTFIKGSNEDVHDHQIEMDGPELDAITIEEVKIEVPKYIKAVVFVPGNTEPHEQKLTTVMSTLTEIVKVEGPIHLDELARRYASAHEKTRVGRRILDVVKRGAKQCISNAIFIEKAGFFATQEQFENVSIRDRSDEGLPTTKAEFISADEIKACAKLITSESGEMPMDELVKAVSGVFGFKRTGPDLYEKIIDALIDV